MDTFRLLSRFGSRLRARHGAGIKRHIKFDDFTGSLYTNVKLPGNTSWTKVSPEMARASVEEEDAKNRKRFATKLLPGPREGLARPLVVTPMVGSISMLRAQGGNQVGAPSQTPASSSATHAPTVAGVRPGPRPRWKPPVTTPAR